MLSYIGFSCLEGKVLTDYLMGLNANIFSMWKAPEEKEDKPNFGVPWKKPNNNACNVAHTS